MNSTIFFILLALGLLFFAIKQTWLGIASIIAAIFFILAIALKKTFSGTKKAAKALTKGMQTEIEKAEGQYPGFSTWEEGLKEAGDKTGKQLFAPGAYPNKPGKMDAYKWQFKGTASASSGIKKFADAFKKLFGM